MSLEASMEATAAKSNLSGPQFLRRVLFRIRRHYWIHGMSALRVAYWRRLGMTIGRDVKLAKLHVTWPHRIRLHDACSLEPYTYFNVTGGYADRLAIDIGEGTFIGSGCEFNIGSRITIGSSCLIASGSRFIDSNHGMELGVPMKQQPESHAEITIGKDVWIGANCIILKGVTIGEGAVIAAGSVLTSSVPPNAIYAGVPARLLRMRR